MKNSCKLKNVFLLGHNPSCINHLVNHIYMPSSVIYDGMFCMLTFKISVRFSNFLPKFRMYIFVSYYVCETHLVWASKASSRAFNFHAYLAPCMMHLISSLVPTKSSTHGNLIARVFWKCLSISHSTFPLFKWLGPPTSLALKAIRVLVTKRLPELKLDK